MAEQTGSVAGVEGAMALTAEYKKKELEKMFTNKQINCGFPDSCMMYVVASDPDTAPPTINLNMLQSAILFMSYFYSFLDL